MSQVNHKPAQRAETLLDQHIGVSNLADASLQLERCNESGVLAGFITLREICVRIRHSKSWAYEHGIVPLIDDDGNIIEARKKPPFPWLPLPRPCVRRGKKLWADEDFNRWYLDIRARANRSSKISTTGTCDSAEVAA